MRKFLISTLALGMILGTTSLAASASTVTVNPGDTFWGIAQNHDVTVDELVESNSNLDPHALPVGSEVHLNGNGQDENVVTHRIYPGNTLYGIAQVYDGVTVNDLLHLNEGIDPYSLQIGSHVNVVEQTQETTTDSNVVYHTVQPGNTFTNIASVYDYVSADDIAAANPNVDPYELTVGTQIAIPLK
ncbi:LysM peptidoglycan-binding domain-containing protein [Bacillus alkalicellulosilyticus]|uniref:LysM peptidoglycan-binding domain-containing protein n=1 Tax=Alkalihalobacterium alkalicellulosilyticum TaxID=1912214 RepID=UPI000998D628|nr:LysM domain-containing protein [Bacillus alkalicellulosilyticus]